MTKIFALILILGLSSTSCSVAEEPDSSTAFWLERITFTEVQWSDEVDSVVVSSDWISIRRVDFKDAIIRKSDWWYEMIIDDRFYLVKENPLDYLVK